MTEDVFRIEREGYVATLWLANAERRNAMGPAFWEQLPERMAELGDDPGVRCIVIAADGPHFTVGLDLQEMGGLLAGSAGQSMAGQKMAFWGEIRRLQAAMTSVANCPKPVVAAIHSYCIGGGVDLATACDIRLASADAIFTVRETRLAMTADVGTLQRLPGLVGRGHVAEMAYTGKDVDAQRACAIGLVNEVYPDRDTLLDAARTLAAEIAANSPLAVAGTKEVLMAPLRAEWEAGLRYVAAWNAAFLPSDDLLEAIAAFMQKRPADFKGQ